MTRRLSLILVIGTLYANIAHGAEPEANPPITTGEWIVTLGANITGAPRYDGAKLFGLYGLPSISIRRAEQPAGFSSPDDGTGISILDTERFAIGPVINLMGGRYRSANRDLNGIKDVPWTLQGGAFAEFWPLTDRLRTRIEVRQGMRGHSDGLVSDLSVDLVQRWGQLTLSGGPRLSWADSHYMDANFGVSDVDAVNNGRVQAFFPGAGFKAAGATLALGYDWSSEWTTKVYARYDRLIGNAAASPIVRELGSRDQLSIGTEIDFSFVVGR